METTTLIDAPAVESTRTTELTILQEAAVEIADNDRLRAALRASDDRIRSFCRTYDTASGSRGFAPYHLRQACKARGLLA